MSHSRQTEQEQATQSMAELAEIRRQQAQKYATEMEQQQQQQQQHGSGAPSTPQPSTSTAYTPPTPTPAQAAARELIMRYFTQLTKGCGNAYCLNPFCASNAGAPKIDNTAAAAKAIELAKGGTASFCSHVPSPSKDGPEVTASRSKLVVLLRKYSTDLRPRVESFQQASAAAVAARDRTFYLAYEKTHRVLAVELEKAEESVDCVDSHGSEEVRRDRKRLGDSVRQLISAVEVAWQGVTAMNAADSR